MQLHGRLNYGDKNLVHIIWEYVKLNEASRDCKLMSDKLI